VRISLGRPSTRWLCAELKNAKGGGWGEAERSLCREVVHDLGASNRGKEDREGKMKGENKQPWGKEGSPSMTKGEERAKNMIRIRLAVGTSMGPIRRGRGGSGGWGEKGAVSRNFFNRKPTTSRNVWGGTLNRTFVRVLHKLNSGSRNMKAPRSHQQ